MMKQGVLLLVLVGLVSSRVPKDEDLNNLVNNKFLNRGPEHLEKAIDDLWKQYTNDELEPPMFYSDTYGKDIIGKNMESIFGRPIYAFQGIQYGEPPTEKNARRFRPSIPSTLYDSGSEPIVANHLGEKCPQSAMIGHNPSGDEDCLYLNVYTPYLPGSNESYPLPVMYFIHGGAFVMGDSSMYLPTKLLEHDVILVTIHYRLGALGFFNLDNEDAPGNSALYDMVLGIKWVNKYIADFGGDPNKVTVFGQSAGSVSANYMLLIPQVKDLIHGVICESGSTLDVWAVDASPREAAEFVALEVGCSIDDDSIMYNCVARADAYDLVRAENKLVGQDRHNGLMGFRGAAPSVQKYDGVDWNLLITKFPREYFESGEINPVPLLIGANAQEGSFVLGIMYKDYLDYNGLVDNELYMENQATTDIMGSFGVNDTSHALSNVFDDYFCPNQNLGTFETAAPCYTDMVGILFLKGSAWECANLHSYYNDNATFFYSFEFTSDDSMYYWLLGQPPVGLDPGVTHSDELMYLFSMPALMDTERQVLTMRRMTTLWTNFATYGDPTPDEDILSWSSLAIHKWNRYLPEDHNFMLMNEDFSPSKEYVERWTVTLDAYLEGVSTTMAATSYSTGTTPWDNSTGSPVTGSTETEPTVTVTYAWTGTGPTTTPNPTDPCSGRPTQAEYDDLQSKSDAYLACMIVFIILFVVAAGGAVYLYKKSKNNE